VLVTRVEGIITKARARRRFQHIVDFERMLAEEGTTIIKLFLHIDADEQKRRLIARRDDPEKPWKLAESDLEDRKKWDEYQRVYEEAISATSTEHAPWYIVPANSKPHRNLIVTRLLVSTLESLRIQPPRPTLENVENLKIV
jgi:polyphosphate kinase 2 (PPK2 family)